MMADVWRGGEMGEAGNYDDLALLNKNLVVAIWLYSPDRVNLVAPKLMEALHAHGIRTIPCSAVRASDRCGMQNYPCIEQRLRNVDAWLRTDRQLPLRRHDQHQLVEHLLLRQPLRFV